MKTLWKNKKPTPLKGLNYLSSNQDFIAHNRSTIINEMFNIKNIQSMNVALQLQMISNGINFLCDLKVSNSTRRELDIFMSGKSVSCKNCKNKISKLKFNMAMHSINNLFLYRNVDSTSFVVDASWTCHKASTKSTAQSWIHVLEGKSLGLGDHEEPRMYKLKWTTTRNLVDGLITQQMINYLGLPINIKVIRIAKV